MQKITKMPPISQRSSETSKLISANKLIKDSGMLNFQSCKIPVSSKLNLDYIELHLQDYGDKIICEFLKFGWPINSIYVCKKSQKCLQFPRGH